MRSLFISLNAKDIKFFWSKINEHLFQREINSWFWENANYFILHFIVIHLHFHYVFKLDEFFSSNLKAVIISWKIFSLTFHWSETHFKVSLYIIVSLSLMRDSLLTTETLNARTKEETYNEINILIILFNKIISFQM